MYLCMLAVPVPTGGLPRLPLLRLQEACVRGPGASQPRRGGLRGLTHRDVPLPPLRPGHALPSLQQLLQAAGDTLRVGGLHREGEGGEVGRKGDATAQGHYTLRVGMLHLEGEGRRGQVRGCNDSGPPVVGLPAPPPHTHTPLRALASVHSPVLPPPRAPCPPTGVAASGPTCSCCAVVRWASLRATCWTGRTTSGSSTTRTAWAGEGAHTPGPAV